MSFRSGSCRPYPPCHRINLRTDATSLLPSTYQSWHAALSDAGLTLAGVDFEEKKVLGASPRTNTISSDIAPNFYPAAIGVWPSVTFGWAVMVAVRGAEPSVERSAVDRRATA
jgi:hypothetical protein